VRPWVLYTVAVALPIVSGLAAYHAAHPRHVPTVTERVRVALERASVADHEAVAACVEYGIDVEMGAVREDRRTSAACMVLLNEGTANGGPYTQLPEREEWSL